MKPYSIDSFIKITLKQENFNDMEKYSARIIKDFKDKLLIT
jgi:hypothetical protein